jgi:CRP-like cAMP-binding protein
MRSSCPSDGLRRALMNTLERGQFGGNRLLGALSAVDFALISPHIRNVSYRLGTRLHETGGPIETVYFPQSGMISILAVMEGGKGVETATVGREGAVGIIAALIGIRAHGRAVVQLAGDVAQVPVAQFRHAVSHSAGIRDLIRRYSDAQLALVNQVAGCNAIHPVTRRLCRWILQTRDRTDNDVFPMTQEFLAEMLGVQRTSVTMLAHELQSLGLIRYRRGQIQIIDRPGLEERACECYSAAQRTIDAVFTDHEKHGPLNGLATRQKDTATEVAILPE